jgi:hypothetical protein
LPANNTIPTKQYHYAFNSNFREHILTGKILFLPCIGICTKLLEESPGKERVHDCDFYHYNTRNGVFFYLSGATYVVRINVNDVLSGDKVRPLMRIYGPLVSSAELRLQRPQGRVWG